MEDLEIGDKVLFKRKSDRHLYTGTIIRFQDSKVEIDDKSIRRV